MSRIFGRSSKSNSHRGSYRGSKEISLLDSDDEEENAGVGLLTGSDGADRQPQGRRPPRKRTSSFLGRLSGAFSTTANAGSSRGSSARSSFTDMVTSEFRLQDHDTFEWRKLVVSREGLTFVDPESGEECDKFPFGAIKTFGVNAPEQLFTFEVKRAGPVGADGEPVAQQDEEEAEFIQKTYGTKDAKEIFMSVNQFVKNVVVPMAEFGNMGDGPARALAPFSSADDPGHYIATVVEDVAGDLMSQKWEVETVGGKSVPVELELTGNGITLSYFTGRTGGLDTVHYNFSGIVNFGAHRRQNLFFFKHNRAMHDDYVGQAGVDDIEQLSFKSPEAMKIFRTISQFARYLAKAKAKAEKEVLEKSQGE